MIGALKANIVTSVIAWMFKIDTIGRLRRWYSAVLCSRKDKPIDVPTTIIKNRRELRAECSISF